MATKDLFLAYGTKANAAAADDGSILIEGYASRPVYDRDGELMKREAFQHSLAKFLRDNPIVLYQHDWTKPLGRITEAEVDDKGLFVRAVLPPAASPSSWKAEVLESVRNGTTKAFSVGGHFLRSGDTIVDCDLMEVSVCNVPKNPEALFSVIEGVKAFEQAGELPTYIELQKIEAERRLNIVELKLATLEMKQNRY